MLNYLDISRNATFYRLHRPLSATKIEQVFRDVSADRIGNYKECTVRSAHPLPLPSRVSLLVFKFEDEPSFLKGSRLKESKFAFLLLIEMDGYLAVMKKHVPDVEKYLGIQIERVDYTTIQFLFSDQNPSYEKLALSYMGISKGSIRRRTLESENLKGQLGSQFSGRSIPTATTLRTSTHRHILRPASSSVAKTDGRSGIIDVLEWVGEIILELKKNVTNNSFLESFAQPISLAAIPLELAPTAIAFDMNSIRESLESEAHLIFRGRSFHGARLDAFFDRMQSTFEVVDGVDGYHAILGGKIVGSLRMNSKSITLISPMLKQMEMITEGKTLDLQSILNAGQQFTVTFNSPEYIYTGRKVFKDNGIGSHCREIEGAMRPLNFGQLTSEKGKVLGTDTNFAPDSIFHFVENQMKSPNSILVCDDLGDEWADYIEFETSSPKIRLMHCKFGKRSTSASQLQEVVAQAIKNIGRVSYNGADLERKLENWRSPYANSRITRIRTAHAESELRINAMRMIESPFYEREIAIVTPFLSKSELVKAFQDVSSGVLVSHHVPQLIWLLSGFVSACKEAAVKPTIFCGD
jgi:hypothetical protein